MALYKLNGKLYNYDPNQNGGFALETQQGGIAVGDLPAGVLTAPVGAVIDQGKGGNQVSGGGTLERVARYPVDPVTGAPTTAPTLSPLEKAQSDLFGTPEERANLTEEDKQKIRDNTRAQFDEQIAAINAYSNQLIGEAKLRGEGRLGQDRAIQNNRGTVGSSFGGAQTSGVQKVNQAEEDAINAERNIKLAGVYDKIDSRALAAIQAEKEDRGKKADAYITFLKGQQTSARDDIKTLATSGIPLEQLPEKDYQALLKDSGYSEQVFKSIYASNAAASKAANIEGFNTKVENGQVITSWFNKTTGKAEFDIRPLGAEDAKNFPHSQFNSSTGDVILWNDQGGTKVIKATQGTNTGLTNMPESYKEWALSGGTKNGSYADYLKGKAGTKFAPTADEKSAANRYIQTLPGYTTADTDKLNSDPAFFYSVLQKAVEAANSTSTPKFDLQPLKNPLTGF